MPSSDGQVVRFSRQVAQRMVDDIQQIHRESTAAMAEHLRRIDDCIAREAELLPFAETPLRRYRNVIQQRFQTIADLYLSYLLPHIATDSAAWTEVVDEATAAFTEEES